MSILDTLANAETLLARRATIAQDVARYRARFGGNGYAGERQFKLVEARLQTAIRAQAQAAGQKITEAAVDALVREHEDYIAALTQDVQDRQRWIELEESLNEIEWRLRLRTSDASLLAAEARLTAVAG